MNALRPRKEENEKPGSRNFEPKWLQKIRSNSGTSISGLNSNSQFSIDLIRDQHRGSTSSVNYRSPNKEARTAPKSTSTSKIGSRLIPKSGLKHSRNSSSTKKLNELANCDKTITEEAESTPRASQNTKSSGASRSRSGSSLSSSSGSMGPVSAEDALHRKLAKLFFWEKNSNSSSDFGYSRNHSSADSSECSEATPPDTHESIPFPTKKSNSNSGIGLSKSTQDVPRVVIEPPEITRRRRKTEESNNRSRSSSLALSFSRSNSRSVSPGHGHRPAPYRSTSSDDVRLRRVLPLPPPPTIGLGTVMDDPDVKDLGLDPMAVRYADHMHMLGYTRNRYVCALLSRESSKEGSRYNGMVMQAFVMRMLRFYKEPLDMSLRKFLFRMALPQEAQQIERMLHNFSVLWNYQNPGIFADDEQVLYVVYSLVMLHTDAFNKNIKHKISKGDYVRNALVDGIAPEIFEYFYDNITATQFRSDDDIGTYIPSQSPSTTSIAASQIQQQPHSQSPFQQPIQQLSQPQQPQQQPQSPSPYSGNSTNSMWYNSFTSDHQPLSATSVPPTALGLPNGIPDDITNMEPLPLHYTNPSEDSGSFSSRRSSSFTWIRDQPTDPYPFLLENRLDAIRPELGSICSCSPFSTWELKGEDDLSFVQQQLSNNDATFLQLVSQRSRPDAYITGQFNDVLEAQSRPGVVEVQVIKFGVVLHPEGKRMFLGGHKPGWREWGVILTSSRLYLTKNVNLVRQLSDRSTAPVDLLQSALVLSTRDMAALLRQPNPLTSHHNEEQLYHFTLFEGGRDIAQQCFAVHSIEEQKQWVQTINAVAVQTSLNVSLQPKSSKHKLDIAMNEVNEQIAAINNDIEIYQRTLKHFQLLAPLHQRTREALVFTAGRYSSKCDGAFAELARLKAYRNVLMHVHAQTEKYQQKENYQD